MRADAVTAVRLPEGWPRPLPAGGPLYDTAKRVVDVAGCLVSLPALLPVIAAACVAVVAESPGPPFYRQWRVGKDGRLFRIVKLRTMVPDADRLGPELTQEADPRITRVGRFLRRWSLDELPQVWNVLAGDMSLVGPRPELPSIVATYTQEQLDVLKVRPGMTGWSQIQGRDDLPIPDKLELDRDYVYSRSLATDVRILLRTLAVVLLGEGIKT